MDDKVAFPAAGSATVRVTKTVVAATVAGNALEFYDFVTYAFFAVYIGQAFFPASTPFASLLLSLAVFGVGFIFRPLGAVVIGAYADRAGRRPAMILTIGLITIATMGLALTPSYASIGLAAPAIVVACRLIQGLALGGEVGPASAFLIEIAPPHSRGLYASWQLASQGMAAFAAGVLGLLLSLILTKPELADWGWRVPFIVSLALIPLAFFLRRAMPETLEGSHTGDPRPLDRATAHPRDHLRDHARLIVLAVLIVLGGTVSTYVGNYMTTYAIATLRMSPALALSATVVGGLSTGIFALSGGWLSDRFGRRPVMLVPRIALAIVTWPLFLLLSRWPDAATLYVATCAVTALTAISAAPSLTIISELLPRQIRASGLAISYAIGVSLFGGTTQFVIAYLIAVTGDATAPAWYVTVTSVVTACAMWALPESRGRRLEG